VKVAVAGLPLSATVASGVPPSLKVIVPVGVKPVQVTVAVNVTAWPVVDGSCEDETVTPGPTVETTCVSDDDAGPQLASLE
jgi:hypothetical protein